MKSDQDREDAPLTHGEFLKLHELLLQMRRDNERNYNDLKEGMSQIQRDVNTIATNTGHTRTGKGQLKKTAGQLKKTA